MDKEIKITPPEGYCIDTENSTFECIKFKKKEFTTYEDIVKNQIKNGHYYIRTTSDIEYSHCGSCYTGNVAVSKKQLEKLLAINKLMNVAKYLNDEWKPDWNNLNEYKWYFTVVYNALDIECNVSFCYSSVFFKSKEFAQQAVEILGEDTIRLALSTDW